MLKVNSPKIWVKILQLENQFCSYMCLQIPFKVTVESPIVKSIINF